MTYNRNMEDAFDDLININPTTIARLEIAAVVDYNDQTNIGYIIQHNSQVPFYNVTDLEIGTGDRIVLISANGIETLICLGVYERMRDD